MGIYSEYLDQISTLDLVAERKKQLTRIAQLRGRDILVYASDSNKARQGAPVAIDNSDLLPITDQVSNLSGNAIDVLLETGGGSGETTEDIVRLLYSRYNSVAFIIPGMAKSAGTIMVMAGDEILMEPSSSLGPIDAQIPWEGKVFSAEAFLKGLERIKSEAATGLNRAYIPILQRISPGEIQSAENALSFAKVLVTEWLKNHKFKNWTVHRTHNPSTEVTEEEKESRANEIAEKLCNHSKWLSHARSIKIPDLESIGLEITDYTKNRDLADAIRRYHVLLQMTFDGTPIYKLFETPTSQINRFVAQPVQFGVPGQIPQMPAIPGPRLAPPVTAAPTGAMLPFKCSKCGEGRLLQADFDQQRPLQRGAERFPSDNKLICGKCKTVHDLLPVRKQIESQVKRRIV